MSEILSPNVLKKTAALTALSAWSFVGMTALEATDDTNVVLAEHVCAPGEFDVIRIDYVEIGRDEFGNPIVKGIEYCADGPDPTPSPSQSPTPSPNPSPSPNPRPTLSPSPQPASTPTIPYSERDDDGDGVKNGIDNCDTVKNPDQSNIDGDADGDVCEGDGDIDGDSILDVNDINPFSIDNDGDGLHDAFDPDSTNPDIDGDGFLDGDQTELEASTNPDGLQNLWYSRVDFDGDGYSAETGDTNESDVCIPDATVDMCDADKDGLANGEEKELGTDINNVDSDNDGVSDLDDNEPLSEAGVEVDEFGITITTTTSSSTSTSSIVESVATELESDSPTTTEIVEIIVNDDIETGSEESNTLPVMLGIAGVAGLLGGLVFAVRRRRNYNEDKQHIESVSPSAGS